MPMCRAAMTSGTVDIPTASATVVKIDDDEFTVFDDESEILHTFWRDNGFMTPEFNPDWRIEPLSEWRKEPPDEPGDWWMFVPEATPANPEGSGFRHIRHVLAHRYGNGDIIIDTIAVRYGLASLQGFYHEDVEERVWWQKANAPSPPVEVGE